MDGETHANQRDIVWGLVFVHYKECPLIEVPLYFVSS